MAAPGHHDGLNIQQGTEGARTGSTFSDMEAEGRQIYELQFLPTHCFVKIYSFIKYISSEGQRAQLKLLKGNGAGLEEMRKDMLWEG